MGAAPIDHAAAGQPSAFEIALDNGDLIGAAKEIEKASAQRSAKGAMDAYYGRFFAAVGQGATAEPYLLRAIALSKSPSEKDQLSFELARAREVDGLVTKAEEDYRRLTTGGTDAAVRQNSILALARLRLGAAPEEAVALLSPLIENAASGSSRWEAYLLLSRAYAIQGRLADSSTALAAAWKEAPLAPVPADAIAVTAMDVAVDHAAANDRAREIGLISISKADSQFTGAAQLPLCGGSLLPSDTVTVAIQADSKQRPIYSVVRASKPGIAHLFTMPLAVARQRLNGPALYVTLRCRSAPDPNIRFVGTTVRDLSSWLAERGYYPPLRPVDPSVGDQLTQLKERLQGLEGRAGPESPVLTPTLLQISFLQAAQSRYAATGNFSDAKATAERVLRILAKADAPADVVEQVRVQTTVATTQNQNIADVTGPAAFELTKAIASEPGATPAQVFAVFNAARGWQLRPAQQLTLADQVLNFMDAKQVGKADPIRQAIELRRASISRDIGATAGIKERLINSGIASDHCEVADRPPSVPPSAVTITSDDYPKDLIRRDITGITTLELAVSASGTIETQRMIVSQPPGLFDAITSEKLSAVTLLPAQQDGRPIPCKGMVQNVRWQMPFQGDFSGQFDGFSQPDK